MSISILDDLLTVRELSKWLRLSESHIYTLVSKKKIPFNKVNKIQMLIILKLQEI
jgi:excisionase family DNA binding protein